MAKILIVDDSVVMRMLVKKSLREAGLGDHEVHEAEGGQEAESLVKSHGDFDLVLCDVNMPGQDGITTLLNLSNQYPTLPVVMVTTEGGDKKVTEMKVSGARAILTKPFEPEDLKELIDPLLKAA